DGIRRNIPASLPESESEPRRACCGLAMADPIEALKRALLPVAVDFPHGRPRLNELRGPQSRCAHEYNKVEQAVGAQSGGALNGDSGGFADRHQPGHNRVRVVIRWTDDLRDLAWRGRAWGQGMVGAGDLTGALNT